MSALKPAKRRGFVSFQNSSGRPILSREDCAYWMEFMRKVLKISTEFELNLPSGRANLTATSSSCILPQSGCSVTGCSHLEECMLTPHPSLCNTRLSGKYLGDDFTCPAENPSDTKHCATCPGWTLACRKLDCAMFTPYCVSCPSFTRKGSSAESADIRKDAAEVRREMTELLQPTGFVGKVGSSGVLEVKRDNSLLHDGGIEIPTVGRRFYWHSFYKMCQQILDLLHERGAHANERCGQHFHILAGYFPQGRDNNPISELEKPVPEIIMANLHQLHRRYELAMFWLMSCGTETASITRWARFRQTIFPYSALRFRMPRILQDLTDNIICMHNAPKNGKYASVAYYLSSFDEAGDVSTFHFENRIADGAQSPAVITAWAALCYALVLKAVRCSQYGIIEVGNRDFVERTKSIQPKLIDGGTREWGENRKADTSKLTEEDVGFLIRLSREMVMFLKPELSDLGPAYYILEALAERPCSYRLIGGDDWKKIEADLLARAPSQAESDLETQIQEVIDLSGITECRSVEEWIDEAAGYLDANATEVATVVFDLLNRGAGRWSNPVGAVIAS